MYIHTSCTTHSDRLPADHLRSLIEEDVLSQLPGSIQSEGTYRILFGGGEGAESRNEKGEERGREEGGEGKRGRREERGGRKGRGLGRRGSDFLSLSLHQILFQLCEQPSVKCQPPTSTAPVRIGSQRE